MTWSARPQLIIHLKALVQNYDLLQKTSHPAACGVVVKCDAYGLGLEKVAPLLFEKGARDFFVAHTFEGQLLRKLLPMARIFILQGFCPQEKDIFIQENLIPVISCLDQWDLCLSVLKKEKDALCPSCR